jgi:LacI family transcriptional regulator
VGREVCESQRKVNADKGEMASTRTVAQQAGVSIGTVSRVMNNKPGVSEATRQRVLEVIHELKYSPFKRPSLSNPTHIGLLVRPFPQAMLYNAFYGDVYHGVEQICRDLRITMSMSTLDLEDSSLGSPPVLLTDERIGGILVIGAVRQEIIERIAAAVRVPLVLVDNWYMRCPWDSIMIDNYAGMSQATEYLIDHGHRSISLVGGPSHPSIVERRAGYEQTLRERGLEPCVVSQPDMEPENGEAAVEELLQVRPETTAIQCVNDSLAVGVLKRLRALGRRVPEDVSLLGFDDIALAQHTMPPLTTLRVDRQGMGRSAVELLLGRLSAQDRAPTKLMVGVTLIERASVAAPRTECVAV